MDSEQVLKLLLDLERVVANFDVGVEIVFLEHSELLEEGLDLEVQPVAGELLGNLDVLDGVLHRS
jgi:hypothetical protein